MPRYPFPCSYLVTMKQKSKKTYVINIKKSICVKDRYLPPNPGVTRGAEAAKYIDLVKMLKNALANII